MKPIIYSLIFGVLTLVAFIFALQYELDKIAIEENVNNYSYVCTVSNIKAETPATEELPPELVQRIAESKYVKTAERRDVVSGRSEGMNAMLEYFMTDDTIDMYGVLDGRVMYVNYDPKTRVEYATLIVQKNWAGILRGQSQVNVRIWHDEGFDPTYGEAFEPDYDGQWLFNGLHVLLIGRFEFDRELNSMNYSSLQIRNPKIASPKNIFDDNPIIYIPNTCDDRAKSDEYLEAEFAKRGLTGQIDKLNACRDVFTIRPVCDTSMLISIVQNKNYINFGRGLTPEDKGKKVCVINQVIFSKNHLKLGDKINIALSDKNFDCSCVTHDAPWKSGYPGFDDELPKYGESEEYEIVGVYNFYRRRNVEEDFLSFSRNDIFIPADDNGLTSYEGVRPCDFSFRILGPDYEKFMDDFEIEINEAGYSFTVADGGWEAFKDNYESISSRKLVSLISAILFFAASLMLFTALVLRHFRYEFGLRRLIGASTFEASQIYVAGYLTLALPALIAALAVTCVVYKKWLVIRMAEVIEEGLPSIGECIGIMGSWAGILFAVGFVLVIVISRINGKKNLLGMIK